MVVLKFRWKKLTPSCLTSSQKWCWWLSYCIDSTLCIRNYSLTFTVLIYFLHKTYIKASGAPEANINRFNNNIIIIAHHHPSPRSTTTPQHCPAADVPSPIASSAWSIIAIWSIGVFLYRCVMLYTGVDDDHYGSNYYGSLHRFWESESTKRMDPVIIIIVTMDRMTVMWSTMAQYQCGKGRGRVCQMGRTRLYQLLQIHSLKELATTSTMGFVTYALGCAGTWCERTTHSNEAEYQPMWQRWYIYMRSRGLIWHCPRSIFL
jgi:hypothetical protein